MSEEIPQWAIDRALTLLGDWGHLGVERHPATQAFAQFIMKHEQPPVDPDVIAVREILTAVTGKSTVWEASAIPAEEVLRGTFDESPIFASALAAYRKHKEPGK